MTLTWGGYVSEATGQHSLGLELTNDSGTTCHLSGYPGISFIDQAGKSLPFLYRHSDQMVTAGAPLNVNLPPGSIAYVLVNKYRCDLGDLQVAATLHFIPPNAASALSLNLSPIQGAPQVTYCGQGDPGSIVAVSPVEPTAEDTFVH